ncbi:MAG: hypothetical protein GY768_19655 [Planctomycetaceae bacterium]|nr:hypothetical protein [Planctomycetaceae bacterium]
MRCFIQIGICFFVSLMVASELLAEANYWNELGGGFEQGYVARNYQRSSFFLAGGEYYDDQDSSRYYESLFPQVPNYVFDPASENMRSNHLYPIPSDMQGADPMRFRMQDGKLQAKMTSFYLSLGAFDDGVAGYNSQFDLHKDRAKQFGAVNYPKTAADGGAGGVIWLTPIGHLKDYMNAGPAKGQWATDPETLTEYEVGGTAEIPVKNFISGANPYNRAASVVGMLNGQFQNPLGGENDFLGFGQFYRVADIWVNVDDIARTSVQSSSRLDQIVKPVEFVESVRPLAPAPSTNHPQLSDQQIQNFGYWGDYQNRTSENQESWFDKMTVTYSLKPQNDGGILSTVLRNGAIKLSRRVDQNELQELLSEHGFEPNDGDGWEFEKNLWSSDNNYTGNHSKLIPSAFYPWWWESNTETGVFPWTGHGFTYDWYFGYSDEDYSRMGMSDEWAANALSEFIIKPGAEFTVVETRELVHYLTDHPAPVQPTLIPEPNTFCLALWGIALLLRRRARRTS